MPGRSRGSPPPIGSTDRGSRPRKRAEGDGQRQADSEQAQRQGELPSQLPGSIRDASEKSRSASRRLGQRSHSRARAGEVDFGNDLGTDQDPDREEEDRGCDRGSCEPFRDTGDGDQRQRDDRQRPSPFQVAARMFIAFRLPIEPSSMRVRDSLRSTTATNLPRRRFGARPCRWG